MNKKRKQSLWYDRLLPVSSDFKHDLLATKGNVLVSENMTQAGIQK